MMKMFKTLLTLLFIGVMGYSVSAAIIPGGDVKIVKDNLVKELSDASANSQNVIMVISDKNKTGEEGSLALANETATLAGNAMVAIVNRDNPEHLALLQKYNLARYPAPYVVILSPDGFIAGGVVPGKMEASKLAAFVPSVKYNEALKARKDKKPAFILIYEKQDAKYTEWMTRLNESAAKLTPAVAVITVSSSDTKEIPFVERLGVKPVAGENTLVVLNSSGQVTEKFNTIPEVDALNASASKQMTKGCGSACPGSKSCGGKTSCGEKK